MTVKTDSVKIEAGWKVALQHEFEQPYFGAIKQFLLAEKKAGKRIYPSGAMLFNAFDSTPFDAVKVVILGQDPYHGEGQAMGLSFSVPRGQAVPASLRNIYKALERTLPSFSVPTHGDLSAWAAQGVFMLNAILTVEHGKAASHKKIGWETFTDAVIKKLSDEKTGLIFMLWGNFAKSKTAFIDAEKHHILTSVHPSPLAGNGFLNCDHFVKANTILQKQGKTPINWQV